MPIVAIKALIKDNLATTDYKLNTSHTYKINATLKNSILNNYNVDIKVIEENKFNVTIKYADYNDIIANTFYFNYNRFKIQSEELELLKNSNSIAWFLVSVYYASFFASNEISNLMGFYNFNFNKEDKKLLINKNSSLDSSIAQKFLLSDTNNFFGKINFIKDENLVEIQCISGGGKPHQLAWDNLLKIVKKIHIKEDADLFSRISRLNNILKNEKKWKRPSEIRNKWNYSSADLYFKNQFQYNNEKNKYFNNFKELKRWSETRTVYSNQQTDEFISILYVYQILFSILDSIKNDIL